MSAETRAGRLNTHFGEGGSVWRGDILQDMRSFPNPIMVDLEQTLIDFSYPGAKGVNPMSSEFLHRAKRIDTVFIVTRIGLYRYEDAREKLRQEGLWDDELILLTRENYDQPDQAKDAIDAYIQHQGLRGKTYHREDFLSGLKYKRLAPVFDQAKDIPLIDDGYENVHNNPGVLGIQVEDWIMSENYRQAFGEDWKNMDGMLVYPTILEAMDLVEEHYAKDAKLR